jgi:hypothetical protein
MAVRTGLEPAISGVTGQRIYRFYFRTKRITRGLQIPPHHYVKGVMLTLLWRKLRDSNPGWSSPHASFQD